MHLFSSNSDNSDDNFSKMKKYNSKDLKRIINSSQEHALNCTLESVKLALEDANCDINTRSKIMKSQYLIQSNIKKKIKDKITSIAGTKTKSQTELELIMYS